jgi:hypothetical protein
VPTSIRGETPGGEEFICYIFRKDRTLLNHFNFEIGGFNEVSNSEKNKKKKFINKIKNWIYF